MNYAEKMILDYALRLMVREKGKWEMGSKNHYWAALNAYERLKELYQEDKK